LEETQKPQWKGEIEYENGIKVIKNPLEPLYGKIEFELEEDLRIGSENDDNYMFYRIRGMAVDSEENIFVADMSNFRIQKFGKNGNYLKTIGRSGQGPGEFEQPTKIQIDRLAGDIYVRDRIMSLEIFNKNGDFKTSITSKNMIVDFFPFDESFILALVSKTAEEDLSSVHILCSLDNKGEIQSPIAQFPHPRLTRRMNSGGTFSTSTGHELSLHFTVLNQEKIVFGYSKDYELNIIDRDGKSQIIVRKNDPKPKFSSKEQSDYKSIKFPVPEFKPYFYSIFSDTNGRIYVQRNKSEDVIRGYGPLDIMDKEVDIFSQDGYYLYKAVLPPNTSLIKDGFLYTREVNEDEGMEYIKRYKIKNWDLIKEGIS